MKREHVFVDVLTGEQKIVERNETAEEKAEREFFQEILAKEQAEIQAKAAAKAALLERLGITEAEAKLLLA